MKYRLSTFIVIFIYCLCLPVSATEPPRLLVEGPPSLSAITKRLQTINTTRVLSIMSLVGVNLPGNPIRIIVAPEESEWAQQAPAWVSGYAISDQHLIVVLPERVISYPYDSLESLLEHELAHILIGRAAGGQSVPRWFNEGLAMVAEHSWDFDDQARLLWALLTDEPTSLTELETLFHQDRATTGHAYTLSHALVRHFMQEFGSEWPKRLLASLSQGYTFEIAFARTTSHSLEQAHAQFWDNQSSWSRWIPVATSSGVLWVSIILLALFVFKKQRQRAEAVKRQWREDDWDF